MLIPYSLVLLLLAATSPSEANLFRRGSHSIVHAASKVHRRAIEHSSGLARDLRIAMDGIWFDNLDKRSINVGHVYCVSSSSSGQLPLGNNSSPIQNPGNSSSSSTAQAPLSSGTRNVTSGSSTATKTSSTQSQSAPTASSTPSSPWNIVQSYEGNSFFNGWSFFTGSDPTGGPVTYIDQGTAQSANLIEINSAGNAVMRVDTTPTVQSTRQSVRITTEFTYTGALVIMDSVHMPTGCGTWPAFWSNGPNWPAGGEIDIVEGVNDYILNQATIHTNPGCNMATSSGGTSNLVMQGNIVGGTNCAANETGNQGCGVRATQANSFGSAFNSAGGGVYAMKWDNTGISIYFFPRGSIPSDISNNAPLPANWGTPMAFWPAAGCNPFEFFNSHSAIFDTTLCGDWAGSVWTGSGIPGQAQSCAQITNTATCQEYILNNGSAFSEAYWEVSSVKIYQTS